MAIYPDRPEGFEAIFPADNMQLAAQGEIIDAAGVAHPDASDSSVSILTRFRYGVDMAIVGLEITPANEAARFGIFSASQAVSSNPAVGALAYSGATFLIEGAAALATSDLFASGRGRNVVDRVHNILDRFLPEDTQELTLAAEVSLGLVGGSAVAMAAREAVDPNPDRSFRDHLQYGMRNVARVTGVCAVQGAALSAGIHSPSPLTIGVAVGTVAGGYVGARKVVNGWRDRNS